MGYSASTFGFEVVRNYGHYEQVRCPYHDDHTPSAIFLTEKGTFHCYGCNTTKQLNELVADGEVISIAPTLKELAVGFDEIADTSVAFSKHSSATEYLTGRGIDYGTAVRYELRFDRIKNAIVFRMLTREDKLIGIVERQIGTSGPRYFVHGQRTPLWPMTIFDPLSTIPLFVSEGPFKAMRLWQSAIVPGGVQSFALFGSNVLDETIEVLAQYDGPIVYIADSDAAGRAAAAHVKSQLPHIHCFAPKHPFDEMTDRDANRVFNKIMSRIGSRDEDFI